MALFFDQPEINETAYLLDEYLNTVSEQCNYYLIESKSNIKIKLKKEDFSNPEKLQETLKQIEADETISALKKQKAVMFIIKGISTSLAVGAVVGLFTMSVIALLGGILVSAIGLLVSLVFIIADTFSKSEVEKSLDNVKKVGKDIDKSISKLERKMSKEKNDDNKAILKEQLKELYKAKAKLNEEEKRIKYELHK